MTDCDCSEHELHRVKVYDAFRLVLQHLPFIISSPKEVYNLLAVGKSAKQMLQAEPLGIIDINACDLHIAKLTNMFRWLTSYPGLVKRMTIQQSQESTSLGCEDKATYAAVAEQLLVFALEKAALVCQPPLRLQSFSTNVLHTPAVLAAMAGAGVTDLALIGLPAGGSGVDKSSTHHHMLEPAFAAALASVKMLRTLTLTANVSEGSVEFDIPYVCALTQLPALETLHFAAAALPAAAVEYLPCPLKQLNVVFGTAEVVNLSHLTALQSLELKALTELSEGSMLPPHLTSLHLRAGGGRIGHLDWSVLSGLRELDVCEASDVAEMLMQSCSSLTNLVDIRLSDVPVSPSSAAQLAPIWRQMPNLLKVSVCFAGGAQGVDLSDILKGIGTAKTLRSLLVEGQALATEASMGAEFVDVCKHFTDLSDLTSLALMGLQRMKRYDPLHLTVLTRLKKLSIAMGNIAVDDTVMTAIGCRLSGLCELNILGCGLTSMSSLPALAMLRNLEHLCLGASRRLFCTDVGLMMLSVLTKLTSLKIDKGEITEEGIIRFQAAVPKALLTFFCKRQ